MAHVEHCIQCSWGSTTCTANGRHGKRGRDPFSPPVCSKSSRKGGEGGNRRHSLGSHVSVQPIAFLGLGKLEVREARQYRKPTRPASRRLTTLLRTANILGRIPSGVLSSFCLPPTGPRRLRLRATYTVMAMPCPTHPDVLSSLECCEKGPEYCRRATPQ